MDCLDLVKEKYFPVVFTPYKPVYKIEKGHTLYAGAPTDKFVIGNVYWLSETEIGENPWFRFADRSDILHRVLHPHKEGGE